LLGIEGPFHQTMSDGSKAKLLWDIELLRWRYQFKKLGTNFLYEVFIENPQKIICQIRGLPHNSDILKMRWTMDQGPIIEFIGQRLVYITEEGERIEIGQSFYELIQLNINTQVELIIPDFYNFRFWATGKWVDSSKSKQSIDIYYFDGTRFNGLVEGLDPIKGTFFYTTGGKFTSTFNRAHNPKTVSSDPTFIDLKTKIATTKDWSCKLSKGLQVYPNGVVFHGKISSLSPCEGVFTNPDNSKFKCLVLPRMGSYDELLIEGEGTYYIQSRRQIFNGTYRNRASKDGLLTFQNGDIWKGEITNFNPDGIGKMTYADGNVFEGIYRNWLGFLDGRGTFKTTRMCRTITFHGVWNNSVCEECNVTFQNGDTYFGRVTGLKIRGPGNFSSDIYGDFEIPEDFDTEKRDKNSIGSLLQFIVEKTCPKLMLKTPSGAFLDPFTHNLWIFTKTHQYFYDQSGLSLIAPFITFSNTNYKLGQYKQLTPDGLIISKKIDTENNEKVSWFNEEFDFLWK